MLSISPADLLIFLLTTFTPASSLELVRIEVPPRRNFITLPQPGVAAYFPSALLMPYLMNCLQIVLLEVQLTICSFYKIPDVEINPFRVHFLLSYPGTQQYIGKTRKI